jgi:hypothetical protein
MGYSLIEQEPKGCILPLGKRTKQKSLGCIRSEARHKTDNEEWKKEQDKHQKNKKRNTT